MPPKFHVAIDVDSVPSEQDIFGDFTTEIPKSSKKLAESGDYRLSELTLTSVAMEKSRDLRAKYLGYGVVRLFREYDATGEIEVESDDTTVAIAAVPNYFSPTEVLSFLGEGVTKRVSHFRMIKSDNPNRFMVLIKFRTNEGARVFYDEFNDRVFSAIESERCKVIFVKSVVFRPLNVSNMNGIPYLLEDPFTLLVKSSTNEQGCASSIVKELPTCPVCLERMDSEVTGLVTISCQHTFHCNCLSKWRDDTCPVCRYSNVSIDSIKKNQADQRCSSCGGSHNLWICLICGNVGCGRYDKKHAIEHYESSQHCFAMDINTQRVWDYAGDNYVHRLLQNESDGKLVELPNSSEGEDSKSKNRDYSIEYSNVLLSQLESQREYYESRLAENADQSGHLLAQKLSLEQALKSNDEKLSNALIEMSRLNARSHSLDRKMEKSELQLKAQLAKWSEERLLFEGMSANMGRMKLENESLRQENEELQEQVKDLMFFLESQEKFKDASDDVKNGTVVMKAKPKS